MESSDVTQTVQQPLTWRMRWVAWRNRILSSPRFQTWAARNRLMRPFARRKAGELFDLVAGFTYTQTLLAFVDSGLLERLSAGACRVADAAEVAGLSEEAAARLLKSASAIQLTEEVAPGVWMLGERGASLQPQEGAKAMIRHHKLLYRDLADPLALLRDNRQSPTKLSEFWRYAARDQVSEESEESVSPYSQLMATSQAMVADEVLGAFDFRGVSSMLDVGGGHGAFASAVARARPNLKLGIFDLPGVVDGARARLGRDDSTCSIALHSGDFFKDALPFGYDCISFVRILHDHDDAPAQALLDSARRALPKGGRILIAEPLADTTAAKAMGETYFGWYLWAMRSGRPRSAEEISKMIETAGFSRIKQLSTAQPMVTSVIVAFA